VAAVGAAELAAAELEVAALEEALEVELNESDSGVVMPVTAESAVQKVRAAKKVESSTVAEQP